MHSDKSAPDVHEISMKSAFSFFPLGLITAFAITVSPTSTLAGPFLGSVEFDLQNNLFPFGSDTVRVSLNDGTSSRNVTVRAGAFGAEASDADGPGGFDPTTLYRNQDDVLLYCIDLLDNLIRPATDYNVYAVGQNEVLGDSSSGNPQRNFARMLDFLGAVNHEMTVQSLGDSSYMNWLEPGVAWLAGAIQVGIWESLYEQNGATLSVTGADSGWFSVAGVGGGNSNLSDDGADFLNSAFASMNNTTDLNAKSVRRFVPTGANGQEISRQELIGDPVTVPAPSSLLLFSLGVSWLLRRRSDESLS